VYEPDNEMIEKYHVTEPSSHFQPQS